MPSKITGKPDFVKQGLKIYLEHKPAKKRWKDRLWVHIRQDKKEWRTTVTLSWQAGLDILFLK